MIYDIDEGPAENEPKNRWWLWPVFLNPITCLAFIGAMKWYFGT